MFGKKNMAVMGTGNIAATMAGTMKSVPEVRRYAVASRERSRAESFAREYGFKQAYGSYEELVRDKKVDLVYIATPISEHYENMKLCIENGKAVLCEKAFTLNEEQAKEIFALAEEKNVFVTEAIWVRYMPMLQTILDVIASRVIGEPVMLTANLGYNIGQVRRMRDPRLGGGALLDLGVYPINFASMLFGDDIISINASCTYTDTGVDEQDSITFRYRDGKVAVLTATMIGTSDRQGVVYGTRGYLVVENINNFETLTVYNSDHVRTAFYKRPKQKTGYEYELLSAVHALREGWLECPEMPHLKTLTVMHEMDAIRSLWGLCYPAEQSSEAVAAAAQEPQDLAGAAQESEHPAPQPSEAAAEAAQEPRAFAEPEGEMPEPRPVTPEELED